jgi:biotin transport system substrate-specific component
MQTAIQHSSTTNTTFGAGFTRSIPGKIVLGLAATVAVAIASRFSIPLWFTPVPLSLQPLAVLGVGLALGPFAGSLAMVAYLVEGALGLPVFSPTGLGGVAQIIGPTGGYLMAYPLVAFIAGAVTRGLQIKLPRFAAAAIGCTAAMVVLYALGARWLMNFSHLSRHQVWIAAVAPFIPGEIVKIAAAAGLYSTFPRSRRI